MNWKPLLSETLHAANLGLAQHVMIATTCRPPEDSSEPHCGELLRKRQCQGKLYNLCSHSSSFFWEIHQGTGGRKLMKGQMEPRSQRKPLRPACGHRATKRQVEAGRGWSKRCHLGSRIKDSFPGPAQAQSERPKTRFEAELKRKPDSPIQQEPKHESRNSILN